MQAMLSSVAPTFGKIDGVESAEWYWSYGEQMRR